MTDKNTENQKKHPKLKTIRFVAPEDLRRGQYVAVKTMKFPVVPASCELQPGRDVEATQLIAIPSSAGDPLRVEAVCLPFVLVVEPDGDARTLDTRRHQLTRLPKSYGELAFDRFRPKKD